MSIKTKISFYCYLLLAILCAGMSSFYILTSRILPYHEEVLGVSWDALQPGFQLLLISFVKGGGALALASTIALLIMLFIPFRRGERWARWAIPAFQLPSLIALNYAPINIAIKTSAHPPLIIFFIGDLLFLAGFIFSLDFGKSKGQGA